MTFRRFQRKKITPLPAPTGDTPESLLARIEAARIGKATLVEVYRDIFDKLEGFETEEQECLTTLKRLLYTTEGPPPGANMISRAKARPAKGKFCNVEVTYKREADYYDPAALPPDVLAAPGVVAKVDAKRIEALQDPRCEHARRKGEWMTPTVSITRKEAGDV